MYCITDGALSGPAASRPVEADRLGVRRATEPGDRKKRRGACLGCNEFQPGDPPMYFHTELILFVSHPQMQTSNISFPPAPLPPCLSLPEFISHVPGLFC